MRKCLCERLVRVQGDLLRQRLCIRLNRRDDSRFERHGKVSPLWSARWGENVRHGAGLFECFLGFVTCVIERMVDIFAKLREVLVDVALGFVPFRLGLGVHSV